MAAPAKAAVKEGIAKLSLELLSSFPDGLAEFQQVDAARWQPVIRASGFKPAR